MKRHIREEEEVQCEKCNLPTTERLTLKDSSIDIRHCSVGVTTTRNCITLAAGKGNIMYQVFFVFFPGHYNLHMVGDDKSKLTTIHYTHMFPALNDKYIICETYTSACCSTDVIHDANVLGFIA